MKKKPNVFIILLNYNGYKDTIDCINSLLNINYDEFKIVVVDNNSTDDSHRILNDYLSDLEIVKYIQTGQNLGFSGGNNIGIKYAIEQNADYICLLNNDTIVEKDFLTYLIEKMEKDKNIGISAGKIMYYNKKNIIWSAGGYIDENKSIGIHYGENQLDIGQYDKEKYVTFLTGCIQVISREVIEKVGLYDEKYFLYMEDVDFCYRVMKHNYKLLYVPESKIYHKIGSSTGGEKSPHVIYYSTRNRLLFNKKNQNNKIIKFRFYIFWMIKMILEPIRKGKDYKYMLIGVIDFFNNKFGMKNFNKN